MPGPGQRCGFRVPLACLLLRIRFLATNQNRSDVIVDQDERRPKTTDAGRLSCSFRRVADKASILEAALHFTRGQVPDRRQNDSPIPARRDMSRKKTTFNTKIDQQTLIILVDTLGGTRLRYPLICRLAIRASRVFECGLTLHLTFSNSRPFVDSQVMELTPDTFRGRSGSVVIFSFSSKEHGYEAD